MEIKTYRFTFWNRQVFIGHGLSALDALKNLGLSTYYAVSYKVEEID